MQDLLSVSTSTLARLIADKSVSAREVMEAYLGQIERVNPALNAVVQLATERCLEEADQADALLQRSGPVGPLHGVPFTVKDSLDTAGVITTAGTMGRATYVPDQDATVVARLKSAGAILLGKTNTPELCLRSQTDNDVYGRTNNPYDLSRCPGGSSGGEAAIIAAGGSPFGIGTDIFGSIRLPSHCCGIAGLKPTSGRVPRTGDILANSVGALDSWAQIGPMSRWVEDLALTLPLISGVDWRDPGIVPMPLALPDDVPLEALRVAYYTDNGHLTPTAETVSIVEAAVEAIRPVVRVVQDKRVKELASLVHEAADAFTVAFSDGGSWVSRLLQRTKTQKPTAYLEKGMAGMTELPIPEYTEKLDWIDAIRSGMLRFMEHCDVILCPVSPQPAVEHSDKPTPGLNYTSTFNVPGWPAVVVRCGTSPEGLPIGVQIVARCWREDVALAVAGYLEREFGGWQRPVF